MAEQQILLNRREATLIRVALLLRLNSLSSTTSSYVDSKALVEKLWPIVATYNPKAKRL